jgi:hypothetical protein
VSGVRAVRGFAIAVAGVAWFRTRHKTRFPRGNALANALVAGALDVTAAALSHLAQSAGR